MFGLICLSGRPPAFVLRACVYLKHTHAPAHTFQLLSTPVFTRHLVENINWRQSNPPPSTLPPESVGAWKRAQARKAGFPLRKCCSSLLSINTGKETPKKRRNEPQTQSFHCKQAGALACPPPSLCVSHARPLHMYVFIEIHPKQTRSLRLVMNAEALCAKSVS